MHRPLRATRSRRAMILYVLANGPAESACRTGEPDGLILRSRPAFRVTWKNISRTPTFAPA